MAEVILNESNFENEVLKANLPIIVDFWAPWCGPCMALMPIIEEIAKEADGFKVGKVNIDDEAGVAQQYSIMSVPTLLFFKDGKVMDQMVGVQSKDTILSKLNQLKA